MDSPQWKKCFDCEHRGHCRLYKVVLQNFCAVDRSTQWGRNICFNTFGGRSQNVCDQAVKNGRVRFVLIWCMVWSGLYCKTKENMVRGKPKKTFCYKYLKFCQCASGGFVLRCRQCKEGEICRRKMKLIESGQNLHWIPDWLWLKTYSKLRIYWNNYWEIIWNDPNKQRGHRRDN